MDEEGGTKGLVKVKESAGIRPDGMCWLGWIKARGSCCQGIWNAVLEQCEQRGCFQKSITSYAWLPARNGRDNPAKIVLLVCSHGHYSWALPVPSTLVNTWLDYWEDMAGWWKSWHTFLQAALGNLLPQNPVCPWSEFRGATLLYQLVPPLKCWHQHRARPPEQGRSSHTSMNTAHAFDQSWSETWSGEFTESFNSAVKTM